MNITYIKKLSGIADDRIVLKKIVDKHILSRPYATRIADYILASQGIKWWNVQGQMAATEMLYRFDDVEFWADGVRYEGFLTDDPLLNYSIKQGDVAMIFDINGWFIKENIG